MWLSEPQFLYLYSGVLTAILPGLGAWSLALSQPNTARVGYFWVEGCAQPRVGATAGGGDTAAASSWVLAEACRDTPPGPASVYLLLQTPALILSLFHHTTYF